MKNKNILDAMNGIDFELVEDAAQDVRPKASKIRLVAIAACVCLIVGAAVAIPIFNRDEPPIDESHSTNAVVFENTMSFVFDAGKMSGLFGYSTDGITTLPAIGLETSELTVIEALISEVQTKEYSSYTQRRVIDEKYVGESIGKIEVKTFWRNFSTNTDTNINYLDAEVFLINGVDHNAAVCLRYLEESDGYTTTHYYTLINSAIGAETLGEFFTKLNASDYFSLSNNASLFEVGENISLSEQHKGYSLDGDARAFIARMILSADGKAVEFNDETKEKILDECSHQASVSGSMLSAGTLSFSIRVLDNGYLLAVIGGSEAYLFDIGETSAKNIIAEIREHGTIISYEDLVEETAVEVTTVLE